MTEKQDLQGWANIFKAHSKKQKGTQLSPDECRMIWESMFKAATKMNEMELSIVGYKAKISALEKDFENYSRGDKDESDVEDERVENLIYNYNEQIHLKFRKGDTVTPDEALALLKLLTYEG